MTVRHLCLLALLPIQVFGGMPPEAERLLQAAGNTNDELARQEALEQLADVPGLDASLHKEVSALAAFAQRWNGSSLKFYTAAVRGKPARSLGDYDFGVAPDSPLQPICDLYRGRMLAWMLIENSTVRTDPKESRWFKDEAVASFRRVNQSFPENSIARMYLGEALPWSTAHDNGNDAPSWAVLQREQIERLAEIIRWWIEHRQREGGEFGGGWGDDCEMWRWWAPVLLGFDDPEITEAQLKFSRAAVRRPHLKDGFNTEIMDVEHAAEDTTDNLVPLMVLEPDNEKWTRWGLKLGDFMRDVWTGRNAAGHLQFKSFYFSATQTAPQPQRALDVMANVGALHPALLAWQRTGDTALGGRICAWLDTWVEASARAENGKPAGVLPASIRWPEGRVGGAADHWWEPVKPGGYMYSYYVWPSVITEMTDAMMLAHVMTGKESYLAPLRSMAAIRLNHLKRPPAGELKPGSVEWCGAQLAPRKNANSNTGGLVKTLARFKALTGTHEFDELIALEGAEFVIRTDKTGMDELVSALRESLGALRVNFPGFTSEVRSTDRCMRFVQFLAQDYAFDDYKGVTQPKHELLYRMVTGDTNAPRFPQMAARWLTPPKDIAVLVTAAGTTSLQAELFHFGSEPRPMGAELRQLKPGRYRASLTVDGKATELATNDVTVEPGRYSRVSFSLPAGKLALLRVE